VLVPVPVHADRRRRRGYDQAELIAAVDAAGLGLPMAPLLRRERSTIAQFDLDRRHRATNVAGAFGLVPGSAGPTRPAAAAARGRAESLAGWWVILLDDVVTTGATLAACAGPLLAAGAVGVSAVTVARER